MINRMHGLRCGIPSLHWIDVEHSNRPGALQHCLYPSTQRSHRLIKKDLAKQLSIPSSSDSRSLGFFEAITMRTKKLKGDTYFTQDLAMVI